MRDGRASILSVGYYFSPIPRQAGSRSIWDLQRLPFLQVCLVLMEIHTLLLGRQPTNLEPTLRIPGARSPKPPAVFLASVPAGELEHVDLALVKGAFRTRLRRCGFRGSFLGGGIEAAWFHRPDVWIVHSHLLGIGVQSGAWDQLDGTLTESGVRNPVQVDLLCDPERQISYLQKFTTYQKLYRRGGRGDPQIVPLPPDRLAELARWWSRNTFDDFPFLVGARRRGGRIVVEA